jgi:YVTN family beta-propeller protein
LTSLLNVFLKIYFSGSLLVELNSRLFTSFISSGLVLSLTLELTNWLSNLAFSCKRTSFRHSPSVQVALPSLSAPPKDRDCLFPIIFLSVTSGGTVSVISTVTNTVTATISLPFDSRPVGVAVTPNGAYVYVTNQDSNEALVSTLVISTVTNTVTATVTVGSLPYGVAVAPNGAYVYVTDDGTDSVLAISTATNTVTGSVTVGSDPSGVAVMPNGEYAYVTHSGMSSTVSVINIGALTASVSPSSSTMDMGQSTMFTATAFGGSGSYTGYQWYVDGSAQSGQTASTFSFVPVSVGSYSITATVTDSSGATSTQSNAATITVNVAPSNPTITVGENPSCIAYDSGKSEIFVANWNSVSVISDSTNTVVATVPVGISSGGVAYDSGKGEIFVTNSGDNTVSVISESSGESQSPSPGPTASTSTTPTPTPTTTPTSSSPSHVSSATSTATVSDNSATVDQSATTGVNVTVSGLSLKDGTEVNVTSTDYGGNQPSGTGTVSVSGAVFYDVSVASSSGALSSDVYATVSILNPSFTSSSVMEYWNGALGFRFPPR